MGEPIFKILDFGSGTGGNLAGIILALQESFQNPPVLKILSIDGNKHMLSYQKQVIEKIISNYSATIDYQAIEFKINTREDLEQIATKAGDGWHYITTFKCLSEIPFVSRIFLEFCKRFAPLLADNGLMLILDVTTKDNLPEFNPILMNREISEFEKSNPFRTLLPLSCAMHSTHCEIRCFTQQQFLVSHSRKNIDKSKVAYRIIGNGPFIDTIISILPGARYVVKWNYSNAENPTADGVCPHCSAHENTADGYLLN